MAFVVPRLTVTFGSYSLKNDAACHADEVEAWGCASPLGNAFWNGIIAAAIGAAGAVHVGCEEFTPASGKWSWIVLGDDAWDCTPPCSLSKIGDFPGCPAGPCGFNEAFEAFARANYARGECGYDLYCETGGSDHLVWFVRNWAWAGTGWCYEGGSCECPSYAGVSLDTPHSLWKGGDSDYRLLGYFGTQRALCAAIVESMRGSYSITNSGCCDSASITVS